MQKLAVPLPWRFYILTQLLMNLSEVKVGELSDWLPDQRKIRHLARMAELQQRFRTLTNV